MSERLLNPDDLAKKLGCSKASIYRAIAKDPRFPRPVTLPGRGADGASKWLDSEVDRYISLLAADRDRAEVA